MKKFLSLIMAACLFSIVACGPSEEEKAKAEAEAKAAVEAMFNEIETAVEETEVVEVEVEEAPADSTAEETTNQ